MPLDLSISESNHDDALATLNFAPYEWEHFKSWCLSRKQDAYPTDAILRVLTSWLSQIQIDMKGRTDCLAVYESECDSGGRVTISFKAPLWSEILQWALKSDEPDVATHMHIMLLEWIVGERVPILRCRKEPHHRDR